MAVGLYLFDDCYIQLDDQWYRPLLLLWLGLVHSILSQPRRQDAAAFPYQGLSGIDIRPEILEMRHNSNIVLGSC